MRWCSRRHKLRSRQYCRLELALMDGMADSVDGTADSEDLCAEVRRFTGVSKLSPYSFCVSRAYKSISSVLSPSQFVSWMSTHVSKVHRNISYITKSLMYIYTVHGTASSQHRLLSSLVLFFSSFPRMATTHQVFFISELVERILEQLKLEARGHDDRFLRYVPDRKSLFAMSRTCKALSEISLDALWKEMDTLLPVFNCMPAEVFQADDPVNTFIRLLHKHLLTQITLAGGRMLVSVSPLCG